MNVQELRNRLEKQKGKREEIEENLTTLKAEIRELTRSLHRHEQAKEIITTVGNITQQQLSVHISDITSLALESVFTNPYALKVDFVQRRNKTECDLMFERDGNMLNPMKESGVGATDVAAFALRIASWSMQIPHTRPIIVLDEPFKHLKGLEQNKLVLEMIREISHRMGIQIIMVSDERIPREDIVEAADKVFEVRIRNGKSRVK
jgi:DNA repair exonuclease SbcCD ATPase subunit